MEGATKKVAYKVIAAGGTFDHLHDGHKAFLSWLFTQAEQVVLGLTSDTFAKDTKQTIVEPFALRKKHIENFLQTNQLLDRLTIVPIHDIYGPLLTNEYEVNAVGVTDGTYRGAELINTKRKALGLGVLPIVRMKLQVGMDGKPISSTAIRLGDIDTNGDSWVKKEWTKNMYTLPQSLRRKLHEPFGPILSSLPQDIDPKKTITVGDVTTKLFNMHRIGQKVSIVDFIVERAKLFHKIEELEFGYTYTHIFLKNPAGHITAEAWSIIGESIIHDLPTVIQVQGEEDLLVLVCILTAPLGYTIFYGQPHAGLVQVEVTLESKKLAFTLMEEFVSVQL